MEEICGKKPGAMIFIYNGYTYKISRNTNILTM